MTKRKKHNKRRSCDKGEEMGYLPIYILSPDFLYPSLSSPLILITERRVKKKCLH
jgi:hypothetical protein